MPESNTLPPYVAIGTRAYPQAAGPAEDTHSDSDIHSYLHILQKRKKIVLSSVLVALAAAVFVNITQRPVYRASTEVVLQRKDVDVSVVSGGPQQGNLMQDPTFLLTQMRLIKGPLLAEKALKKIESPEIRRPLFESFAVHSSGKPETGAVFSERERRALLGRLRSSISASQVERGASILAISMDGYDPLVTKQMVDVVAESYVELNYELQIGSFKKSFTVISKSLGEVGEKIKAGELALQKVTKEIELLEALKIYGGKYPVVVSHRAAVASLSEKLASGIKNYERMDIGLQKVRFSVLLEPHLDLNTLMPVEADLQNLKAILEQEVHTNREMYNSIFKRLQEVELTEGRNQWFDAKVLEPAGIPSRPIRPNKMANLLGALALGILIGVGLVYFFEYLDSSLRTIDDIRSYLKIFPLGQVPYVERLLENEEDTLSDLDMRSPRPFWNTSDINLPLYVAEAYRIIRTNLAFGAMERSIKVLQVTSSIKGEGKTTTVCNLGISLAQAGIKTLLVDADMRRPSLHYILKLGGHEEGLSNALTNGVAWSQLVHATKIPYLYCMTAGVIPPNPAELLSSKRIKELLNELKENFDLVILDTPPVISVADSSIVAASVEGVILVSRAGFIPRHLSLHAKTALESVNGRIVGAILNGVMEHHQSYYSGYYGKYYGDQDHYGYYGQQTPPQPNTVRKRAGVVPVKSGHGNIAISERLGALQAPLSAILRAIFSQFNRLFPGGRSSDETKPGDDRL